MVTRSRNSATKKKNTVKVGKLKVNKETVKDLSGAEKKKVKGGLATQTPAGLIRETYFETEERVNSFR